MCLTLSLLLPACCFLSAPMRSMMPVEAVHRSLSLHSLSAHGQHDARFRCSHQMSLRCIAQAVDLEMCCSSSLVLKFLTQVPVLNRTVPLVRAASILSHPLEQVGSGCKHSLALRGGGHAGSRLCKETTTHSTVQGALVNRHRCDVKDLWQRRIKVSMY